MNTVERRCLATSAVAHSAMVVVLVVASAVAARRVLEPDALPPIELISLEGVRITDGSGAGGGTPTPPPSAPTLPTTAPATPPPRVIPIPPQRVARVTPVPIQVTPAPTRTERSEKPEKPEKPDKPERTETGIKVSSTLVQAQDIDPSTKGKADPRDGPRPAGRRPIAVAAAPQGPSAAEIAEAKAAAERAANDARERAARMAAEQWKNAVGGIRSKLAQGLSGQTEISTPGPGGGGEVWVGYGTYLKTFYEARWRRPSSLPVPVAYVGIAITVARDGRLVRFELVEKSGIKSLDDSVLEVIQRYRNLEPLPSGSTDPERTFRIKFRLEGTTQ